jgi:hypothetical protein
VRAGQRQALDIYLWSRAAIWIAAIFAFFFFEPNRHPDASRWDTPRLHELGYFTDIWARWDSDFFLRIAQNGYDGASAAFHPLYPALVAVLGRVLFGHYVLAGLIVSLTCCLGSFLLLYRLAEERLGPAGAERSVLYLAVFPMSLFLQAVYSESLFLLLVLAAFAVAERNRFATAGVLAGLAILTRAAGIALLPALALLAWRERDRLRALGGVALALPVAAIYPLVLWQQVDDPWAFSNAQDRWHGTSHPPARSVESGTVPSRPGAGSSSSSSVTARMSPAPIRCTQRRRMCRRSSSSCSSSRSLSSPGADSARRTASSPRSALRSRSAIRARAGRCSPCRDSGS